MNWKHTKTFLMILLFAVNVFLFFLVANYYGEIFSTDDETVGSAVSLLKKGGITVDPKLLDIKTEAADILSCDYDRETYMCAVASLLFGKEADGIYLLPNGMRAETYEGQSALIGYDLSIEFEAAELSGKAKALSDSATPLPAGEAKKALAMLENLIKLPSGTLGDEKCFTAEGCTFITVLQKESGLPLHGMSCVFGIKNEKIVYASGKHFFYMPQDKKSTQILSRINILFSEKERGTTGDVSDITFCYTLYEEPENGKMLFVPSYSITYTGGKESVINAISKELY